MIKLSAFVLLFISLKEDNVIVYLAGYVGKKARSRFACRDCEQMWMRSSVDLHDIVLDKPDNAFMLWQNKQYDNHLVEVGLFPPSQPLINFVSSLETVFRQCVMPAVHCTKVRVKFLLKAYEADAVCAITCGTVDCLAARRYMMKLYFVVKMHHVRLTPRA